MGSLKSFELSKLPPSANSIWRAIGSRVIKSAEYRKWLEETAWEIRQCAGPGCVEGGYALHVQFVRQSKRKSDLDNMIKPLSDAIVRAGLVQDDHYCMSVKAKWAFEGPAVKAWIISTSESAL